MRGQVNHFFGLIPAKNMVLSDRVIVRLGCQNCMVTKGYQKGVYERVTSGTCAR